MAALGAEEVEMKAVIADRHPAAAFPAEAGVERPVAGPPAEIPEAAAEAAMVANRCRRRMRKWSLRADRLEAATPQAATVR